MLKISDFAPQSLEACPKARLAWEEFRRQWKGCPPLYFFEVAGFTTYLLNCQEHSQFEELKRLFG